MTTYYVDARTGNDAADGRSTTTAWRTLTKASGASLAPGDAILLARGSTFDTELQLSGAADSGTNAAPIRVATYGSGAAPVIDGGAHLGAAPWTSVGNNVWRTAVANKSGPQPQSLWLNGARANEESGSTAAVDQTGDWYHDGSTLYLYGNPSNYQDITLAGVRKAGIWVYDADHVDIADVTVRYSHNGILLEDASDITVTAVTALQNAAEGLLMLRDGTTGNEIVGGRYALNGVIRGTTGDNLGSGISLTGQNHVVRNTQLDQNGEHGVVVYGNGHQLRDVTAANNGETGVTFKAGSHQLSGSDIFGNKANSAVDLTSGVGLIRISDSELSMPSGLNRYLLRVGEGAVQSTNSRFTGGDAPMIFLGAGADGASSFTGDLFHGTTLRSGASLMRVEGGQGHVVDEATFVVAKSGAHAVHVQGGSLRIEDSSLFAENGLLLNWAGGSYTGDRNAFSRATGTEYVRVAGVGYSESDIDNDRLARERGIEANSTTPVLDADQLVAAWAGGGDSGGGGGGSDPGGGDPGGGSGGGGTGGGGTGTGVVWTGGSGNDSYVGTEGDDQLNGAGGDDRLEGRGGNDTLIGGSGRDQLFGGAGNDLMRGDDGNDTLTGGAGDDRIEASWGSDRIVYGRGDGADVVVEKGGNDRIDFVGIPRSEASFANDAGDLVVTVGADSVTVEDHFAAASSLVESFVFSDGTIAAANIVLTGTASATDDGSDTGGGDPDGGDPGGDATSGGAGVVWTGGSGNDSYVGTDGDDRLDGAGGDDRLEGLAGNDTLIGGAGRDELLGGAGNDVLRADDGNDLLTGGTGDDRIEASWGADRIRYARGDGNDVVTERGGSDQIAFVGIARGEASFANRGGDLVVTHGAGSVTVDDHFANGAAAIESFVFSDGTLTAGDVALLV